MIPNLDTSLRTRILLVVLVAVLPPLGLLGFMGLETRAMAGQNALDEAMRLGRLASAEHQRIVSEVRQLLTTLAVLPEVRHPAEDGCHDLLATLRASRPYIANIGVIELDGNVVCSGLPLSSPVNAADRSYFQRALSSEDFAAGDYQLGRITRVYSINFGYPVRDDNGKIQSVVFAAVDLSWLNRLADEVELPESSTLTVFDRNGTVLARHPGGADWTGQSVPRTPLVQTILSQDGDGTGRVRDLDRKDRLFAFSSLAGAGEGVVLAVGLSTEVAYASADRAVAGLLIGAGFIAILALLTAWYGSEAFGLHRLRLVLRSTERLASGDFAARVGPPYGPAELGALALAVDEVALRLETSSAERERSKMEAARLTSAWQLAGDWLRLLIRAPSEAGVLQRACDIAVQRAGCRAAWVWVTERTDEWLRVQAGAGLEAGISEALKVRLREGDAAGRGDPVNKVFQDGLPIVLRDLTQPEDQEPWIELAAHLGGSTILLLPLQSDETVTGCLCLCDEDPDSFGQGEVEALAEAARSLGASVPPSYGDTAG
jgi:hypothetical protein